MHIQDFLRRLVEVKGSDGHLKAGMPPGVRVSGKIVPQGDARLTPADTERMAREILDAKSWERFAECNDLDSSYSLPGVGRFRVNVMRQRGSIAMVLRHIPQEIPSFEKLGLPPVCRELTSKPRGLVLVTGPTGSGKSTTLAAMIDLINSTHSGHILTMEDPIEFLHPDKKCFINQREVGADTRNFAEALRRALRQDPDVILIGEMRDLETIALAVTAAETGHLVFGTLHTTSAAKTIDRVVGVFPPDQQTQIRMQLAGTLQGIISQTLLEKEGGGRVAAMEVLVAVDAVRAMIRENKLAQIPSTMQTGKKFGMQTLEEHLSVLVAKGLVSYDNAIAKANNPDLVRAPAGAATARTPVFS